MVTDLTKSSERAATAGRKATEKVASSVRRARMTVATVLRLITVVLLTVFVMQNLSSASMDFLVWTADVPLFLIALVFTMLGFTTGYLSKRSATKHKR